MKNYLPYHMLKRNVLLYKDKVGFYDAELDKEYSFYDLFLETEMLAAGLVKIGLKKGDRVAVLARNTYRFFTLFFAASKLGLILVLINKRLSKEEKEFVIQDTTPKIIFSDKDELNFSREIKEKFSFVEYCILLVGDESGEKKYSELLLKNEQTDILGQEDDPYMIIHTAAVDAKPRGGVLSQKNIVLITLSLNSELNLTKRDAYLNILPLFHIMGINLAFATFIDGGTNVVIPSFDRDLSADLLVKKDITLLGTFPPILASLLDTLDKKGLHPKALKQVVGLEQPDIIQRLQNSTNAKFICMYGQTETSGLITLAPFDEKPQNAGRPINLCHIMIVDENDNELPIGEVGEIAITGPLVFLGYWNREKDNEYVFRNNIHHTGDLGFLDQDGYLFFKGRKPEKELIKSGGENVYPPEVEEVILKHQDIVEVCVIGVPDPQFGEGIKAVCVKKQGSSLTESELIEFVGNRIARYKKPRYVVFVDELPKDKNGKVDRIKVKELFGKN